MSLIIATCTLSADITTQRTHNPKLKAWKELHMIAPTNTEQTRHQPKIHPTNHWLLFYIDKTLRWHQNTQHKSSTTSTLLMKGAVYHRHPKETFYKSLQRTQKIPVDPLRWHTIQIKYFQHMERSTHNYRPTPEKVQRGGSTPDRPNYLSTKA